MFSESNIISHRENGEEERYSAGDSFIDYGVREFMLGVRTV